jgi:hypothetical protein
MPDSPKLIARRQPTAAAAADTGRTTGQLDVSSEEVRRLAVFAAVAAAVWSFGLFMDLVVLPAAGAPGAPQWR